MAVLGNCPAAGNFAASVPYIAMNEVTTVAAAYAFAGFATDATHVSSSGTPLALTGIANAFANAANLASITGGTAIVTTPSGTGGAPTSLVNTLANILAACINTAGAVTGPTNPTPCYTLFYNAQSKGSSGVVPTDVATAAINIAHNPSSNVTALYNLQVPFGPFQGTYYTLPISFVISINYRGGGLAAPYRIAIDGSGDAWVLNESSHNVVELSSSGVFLSGPSGYSSTALTSPNALALDSAGNAWITNFPPSNSITKLSSTGAVLSGASGYTGGGLSSPTGIAIDGAGIAWISNATPASVSKFSPAGAAISGANGYTGDGFNAVDGPSAIAVDGAGSVWITNTNNPGNPSNVIKLSNTGTVLSGVNGYVGTAAWKPTVVSIDGVGNAWTSGYLSSGAVELSNSGALLLDAGYAATGSSSGSGMSLDGAGNVWVSDLASSKILELSSSGATLYYANSSNTTGAFASPYGVAVDGSGNVWIANSRDGYNSVTEMIGAAVPVITPIAAGLPATPTSDGSSRLATRP